MERTSSDEKVRRDSVTESTDSAESLRPVKGSESGLLLA